MDQKSKIKDRRKERIRTLLELTSEQPLPETGRLELGAEPDPEVMWKARRKDWEEDGGGRRPRFVGGFLRRMIVSALLFGVIWGVFAVERPWTYIAQDFIAEALNEDMDFESVRVWYEKQFDGAPAFIPIFDAKDEPSEKVTAHHEWAAPVTGNIVQPFAASLKGVEIMPEIDSSGNVTVKSVDMGRVLSVTKELQGGIRVIVRHTGNVTAEYGHLSGTKLEVDDWLQSGDSVGWLLQEDPTSMPMLFFAVMKDKAYIDPSEVISFD